MARPLRIEFPGALYHITGRGNASQDIYLDDVDRKRFMSLLGREVEQQRWCCYAFCLMSNHYHLLIETPEGNLVAGMRRLNGHYTQWFNWKHKRVGHLFQGRYKSIVVEHDSYFKELCRYIPLNPVRAGMVKDPVKWAWSSYQSIVSRKTSYEWLDVNAVLAHFGSKKSKSQQVYKQFVLDGIGMDSPWKELHGQIWLGGEEFRTKMQDLVNKYSLNDIPITQTQPARPEKREVIDAVLNEFKLSEMKLWQRRNQEAFKAVVFLLRRSVNLNLKDVAKISGVSVSRISQIQSEVEGGQNMSKKLMRLIRRYKIKN